MNRDQHDRINPFVLLLIAIAVLIAAFFFRTDHPVADSNLYASHAPGWIALVLFILIGVLWRVIDIRDRRRHAKKRDRDSAHKI